MRDLHVTVSKTLFWNIRSESYKITPSGTHQGQETGSLKRHLFCMQTPQFLFILPWFLGWHSCVDSCFRTLRCSKLGSSVLQVAVNFPLLVAAVGIFLINLVFANFSLNWINLSFQPPHMDDKELIIEAECLGGKKSTPVFLPLICNTEHFCDPVCRVFSTASSFLTLQLGVVQLSSVLKLSTWNQRHSSQGKGTDLQDCHTSISEANLNSKLCYLCFWPT